MSFVQKIEQVTEAKWYKLMMPKLYGWGAAVRYGYTFLNLKEPFMYGLVNVLVNILYYRS